MTQHTPEFLPQMQNPPQARPIPTAWQSVPKFIRFTVWLYAVASVVGVALWVVAMLVFVVGAAS